VILRQVVEGLPDELLTEEFTQLVRATTRQILKLLWVVHISTNASTLRWRLACTDPEDEDLAVEPPDVSASPLRAYFILAGEGLEFISSGNVDPARAAATASLSKQSIARMDSNDWATSIAKPNANITEAKKLVPPGWTVFLKTDKWVDTERRQAVYRLPRTGKRMYIQVDIEKKASLAPETSGSEAKGEDSISPSSILKYFGPFAGFMVALFAALRRSPPFLEGQKRRKEVDEVLRALQKQPILQPGSGKDITRFEQKLWMDFGDADEAPVVLVLGGQSETGRVISRKLLMRGYHVVLLQPGSATGKGASVGKRVLMQGATLTSTKANTTASTVYLKSIPDDVYDAVSGVDKIVVCECDAKADPRAALTVQSVKNVLACWQLYRSDFAEGQRAYTSKVRLFNFKRETDFELWDLERKRPSDSCYGLQKAGWTRNSSGTALFIGQFFEPVGQVTLKSPVLKLNFKRFGGLLITVYNQAVPNRYSFFLRMSDFDDTRVQYEFEFNCDPSSWHTVRMPFNSFKPVRADGVPLPQEMAEGLPLDRQDVTQIGIVLRTEPDVDPDVNEVYNYFSLAIDQIRVFRTQAEPQVVYVGVEDEEDLRIAREYDEEEEEGDDAPEMVMLSDLDDLQKKAEEEAAREIDMIVSNPEIENNEEAVQEFWKGRPRSAAQAVVESGLGFSVVKVRGLNEHAGGRYPISVRQASVKDAPLKPGADHPDIGKISRGDAAEIVVSALTQNTCVNTELVAGESVRGDAQKATQTVPGSNLLSPPYEIGFEISSTSQQSVK